MAINKLYIPFLLLLIALASLNFQCKKRFGCADTVYSFEIGIKAYPDSDSINIGDTIWLEINTPDILRDKQTNALINYSGVENLGSVISFQKLDNNSFTIKALNKFKLILLKGTKVNNTIDPDLFNEYLFDDKNGYYQFKLGVIALEAGVFRIALSNAANVYRKSDGCTKANFVINFEQTSQHYYLYPGFQGNPNEKSGTYYFKVK